MDIINGHQTRVYMDGCFDLFHYGHANAIRQAKALGDWLVVGIHSDDEIERNKRYPVFNETERYRLLRGLKWVDEVVEDTPYSPSLELLETLNCDFATHADDLAIAKDGSDTYGQVRMAGKLRLFQRTEGVSTTDIIDRVLERFDRLQLIQTKGMTKCDLEYKFPEILDQSSLSSSRIFEFSEGYCETLPGQRVVFVAGAFDMFHPGHMDFLEAARKQGDRLIVGVYSDTVVHKKKGGIFPIMNLNERALGVLSCKCVDEIVADAPVKITSSFLKLKKIDIVCHGWTEVAAPEFDVDPFKVAREMNILKIIDTGNHLTGKEILQRIISRRSEYEYSNEEKRKRDSEN